VSDSLIYTRRMTPRQRARDRLPELVEAALHVFTMRGYRATQMADIAREMGVSEAALYRYVDGKEGLFLLVVRQALLKEEPSGDELPISSPTLEATLKEITEHIRREPLPVRLRQALHGRHREDPETEFEQVVRELFSLAGETRQAVDMIERSARELPELAEMISTELRAPLLAALSTYLSRRSRSGVLRTTPDSSVTARLIIETVMWFARHRFSDPQGEAILGSLAEETVVDILVHSLAPTA
jgi:AcrR family transcriptional regulator